MPHWALIRKMAGATAAGLLTLVGTAVSPAQGTTETGGKVLSSATRFYVPSPAAGSKQQIISLLEEGKQRAATLIAVMELTPQAVWLTNGTPEQVQSTVAGVMKAAARQGTVPVFVAYNIPGRDCGSYSAGGAENTAAYQAWIDGLVQGIGGKKAVIALEPDALANLPSDCGYNPATVNIAQATADRYTQVNYAVTALETGANTSVYLDAGNSSWQAVGTIASRLVTAGVQGAQGYFSNVSNFRQSAYESKFDTWVSECVAFANNANDGGWRLGHYDWCASQYYSPQGPVNPNDITTWVYTDEWYTQNLGTAVPALHFIIDTSRNGQGPLDANVYNDAPYSQPTSVVNTIAGGSWCNPPGRGLGLHPTANTGVLLLDAYLWVKTPGQSDGTCDAAGGARAWDYAAYTKSSWPTVAVAQAIFDPLWGLDDPAAGAWFPQQALEMARKANPSLLP